MLTGPTQPLPADARGMRRLDKVVSALFIALGERLVHGVRPMP